MLFGLFSYCRRQKNRDKIQAAFRAVKLGNLTILNTLLNTELDINCRRKDGDYTLLHYAIISTNMVNLDIMQPIIQYLLENDALPNNYYHINNAFFNPLHSATRKKLPSVVKLLLEYDADTSFRNDKNKTAQDYVHDAQDNRGQETREALEQQEKISNQFRYSIL